MNIRESQRSHPLSINKYVCIRIYYIYIFIYIYTYIEHFHPMVSRIWCHSCHAKLPPWQETTEVAWAFKPNAAFFEVYGSAGWEALQRVLQLIPPEIRGSARGITWWFQVISREFTQQKCWFHGRLYVWYGRVWHGMAWYVCLWLFMHL